MKRPFCITTNDKQFDCFVFAHKFCVLIDKWCAFAFILHEYTFLFVLCASAIQNHTYIYCHNNNEPISLSIMSQISFWNVIRMKLILISIFVFRFVLVHRYFDRYQGRLSNRRCQKWFVANNICDIVHGVCTDFWLSRWSIFTTMDYDLRCCIMEWYNIGWLIYAIVWMVYYIPCISWYRWSII